MVLRLEVRTPHELIGEFEASALRVPSDTGQVGLRPRHEPLVLAVEAGLTEVHTREGLWCVGTAGGLLRSDGARAVLLTSDAVVGQDAGAVLEQLDRMLAAPDPEREIRRAIERLELGLAQQMRAGGPHAPSTLRERLRP